MEGILIKEENDVVTVHAGKNVSTYGSGDIRFFDEKFIVAEAGGYWFLDDIGGKQAATPTDWMFAASIKELSFCNYFGKRKYFQDNFNRSEVYKVGREKPKYEFRLNHFTA